MLSMASVANAGIWLSVNGEVDPPDTEITLNPSDHAIIDIYGDDAEQGTYYLGVVAGDLGSLDISSAVILYGGTNTGIVWEDNPDAAGHFGIENPVITVLLTDLREPGDTNPLLPLTGKLVDLIDFHCDGGEVPNDVTLILGFEDGSIMDTQVIHNTPEPMTMALLGLGGLFLRRRK